MAPDFRQLVGKRVVMTGGAANIGRATALLLAEHGARLVIGDVDEVGTSGTVEAINRAGGEALFVRTDVTDEEAMVHLMATAAAWLSGIDGGFFNAGLQRAGAVTDFSTQDWDALFRVNPRHCFLGAKHITPHLREAGGGTITFTSSLAGVKGGPGLAAYSASKGAIVALGRALATELAPSKIRVNSILPGWVDTPFNDPAISFMGGREAQDQTLRRTVPLGRQAVPREIASSVLHLVSDASSYMTGQILVVDGGVA